MFILLREQFVVKDSIEWQTVGKHIHEKVNCSQPLKFNPVLSFSVF